MINILVFKKKNILCYMQGSFGLTLGKNKQYDTATN